MHEVGELDRILNEEDRHVVTNEVEVALLGVELRREPTRVAHRVGEGAEGQRKRRFRPRNKSVGAHKGAVKRVG